MSIELSVRDAIGLRSAAQGLSHPLGLDVAGVLDRTWALQGQDLPGVTAALAIRARCSEQQVREAFDRGEVVRGWPMRSTLFATTPQHLADFLSLTRHRLDKQMAKRREAVGIGEDQLGIARRVAVAATRSKGVTRAELLQAFTGEGLELKAGHGYHLIFSLSHEGLIHWGPFRGKEQELVATTVAASGDSPEEKLARVVLGYVTGRCPVTIDDIVWWMKLPKTAIRSAVEALGDALVEVQVDSVPMLVTAQALDEAPSHKLDKTEILVLPAFDEWYLGYRDRGLIASKAVEAGVVPGNNGVFRPLLTIGGAIVATWRWEGRGTKRRAVLGGALVELSSRQISALQMRLDEHSAG